MNFKYTSIILLSLCCSALGEVSEKDVEKWFADLIEKYLEDCNDTISDDGLQQLKEDMETDDGEVRDFRLCLAEHREYIKESKINVPPLLDDLKHYAKKITPHEKELAEKMFNNCKEEGEEQEADKDIIGKFTMCVIDRCKSGL